MHPRICRCCGASIQAQVVETKNPNICADCERLLEDESPREAVAKLLAAQDAAPAAALEVSLKEEDAPDEISRVSRVSRII